MQRRLRLLAALAGFVVLIVVIAFVAAFRNTSGTTTTSRVAIDARGLEANAFRAVRQLTDLTIDGEQVREIDLYVVRTADGVHALWARSPHLGCRTVPSGHGFDDPCSGAKFAIDGRCLSGPCPRNLDEFAVVHDGGSTYADLEQFLRGAPSHVSS
jgi:Rieske Fe-S protein